MAGFHKNSSNHIDQGNFESSGMLSEINVTPMVDVMLVLLIIFMVSAPLMQQGIQVDLPKTKSPALSEQEKPIVLVIDKSGDVEVAGTAIKNSEITEKLRAIYEKRPKKEIFIHADKGIPYGLVASIMAQIQSAGILRIGLVTEPKNSSSQ